MNQLVNALDILQGLLWHDYVLYTILGFGVLFTLWTGFGQYRALTHGFAVIRGKYDNPDDPGAINHLQALSAALSATVGLGNIGGVALAVALGGPGAVFWMWVVGFFGMALKMTEVTLSMLYRNIDDPDNPHGGPMWVCEKGFAEYFPAAKRFGTFLGGVFVITCIISAVTGGNMFQSWNVAEVTTQTVREMTGVSIPREAIGVVLAILVGMVIIGGIKRIGAVAGRLVPFMCLAYIIIGVIVLTMNIGKIPGLLALIVNSAFNPTQASGAFVGGAFGSAFLFGMKRALFSNEAGQGSAPIAHAAAKTDEPVREGIIAGIGPFLDTLVICTITALVILASGIWDREVGEAVVPEGAALVQTAPDSGLWVTNFTDPPERINGGQWNTGDELYVVISAEPNEAAGTNLHMLKGIIAKSNGGTASQESGGGSSSLTIEWTPHEWSPPKPQEDGAAADPPLLVSGHVYQEFKGAALTAKAFDRSFGGYRIGSWLVMISSWLFALSTMISWSYYGEQGYYYLFGQRGIMFYRLAYCALIVVATTSILKTVEQVDTLTGFGTGVMLFANLPIMLIFGSKAMRHYHDYNRRLKAGEFPVHKAPSIMDVVAGRYHNKDSR